MGRLGRVFKKAQYLLVISMVMVIGGCGITYYTPGPDNERIEIPKSLAYSIKVMESSKTLYNRILTATNELYEQDSLTVDQLDKILNVANRYKAAHNTAQKGVSLWFSTYKNTTLEVDKLMVIQDVFKLVSMAPEVLNDINTIANTDLKLPSGLDLNSLLDIVDTDKFIDINSSDLCTDCR